jgi:hypothetical protein
MRHYMLKAIHTPSIHFRFPTKWRELVHDSYLGQTSSPASDFLSWYINLCSDHALSCGISLKYQIWSVFVISVECLAAWILNSGNIFKNYIQIEKFTST